MAYIYTFTPPAELTTETMATKVGITDHWPSGRLGKYQLPYGPTWCASFSWLAYHPDIEVIKWLEGSVLGHFRHQNQGLGPGMTEWMVGVTWQDIRQHVISVCNDSQISLLDLGEGPWDAVRINAEVKEAISKISAE